MMVGAEKLVTMAVWFFKKKSHLLFVTVSQSWSIVQWGSVTTYVPSNLSESTKGTFEYLVTVHTAFWETFTSFF